MTTRAQRRRGLAQRWLPFVVAVALVVMHTLGALHRAVHVAHARAGEASSFASAAATATSPRADASWVERLFAGHDHSRDCDAFDQSAHGDAAVGTQPALVFAVSTSEELSRHAAWQLAAQARGALARGPPALA